MSETKECPLCHSDKVSKISNDKFGDMYYCTACEHRFRHQEEVDNTIK